MSAHWEPIGDQHKTGDAILLTHKDHPDLKVWGRWILEPMYPDYRWVDDGDSEFNESTFTHAYIVPPFEP
jgi:hypothetical protein